MKILCFGDSNTWGYDPRGHFGGRYDHPWPEILARKLSCCTFLNWGENGREIPWNTIDFPVDTDLLIIMLGTNDLLQGASPEDVCNKMDHFLKCLNNKNTLLLAPPSMKLGTWVSSLSLIDNSKSLAKFYKALAEHLNIRFADAGEWNIPLSYDGVHMTEEGHCAFADRLFLYLNKGE